MSTLELEMGMCDEPLTRGPRPRLQPLSETAYLHAALTRSSALGLPAEASADCHGQAENTLLRTVTSSQTPQ